MKRLIKKSENSKININEMGTMVQLNELDEADVRHDRCPFCKKEPLKRDDGFKICENCHSVFKVLDGDGFVVSLRP